MCEILEQNIAQIISSGGERVFAADTHQTSWPPSQICPLTATTEHNAEQADQTQKGTGQKHLNQKHQKNSLKLIEKGGVGGGGGVTATFQWPILRKAFAKQERDKKPMEDMDSYWRVVWQREFVLMNFTGNGWIHSKCQVEDGRGARGGWARGAVPREEEWRTKNERGWVSECIKYMKRRGERMVKEKNGQGIIEMPVDWLTSTDTLKQRSDTLTLVSWAECVCCKSPSEKGVWAMQWHLKWSLWITSFYKSGIFITKLQQ